MDTVVYQVIKSEMQLKMKNVYTLLKKPDKSSVTNPETIRE